MTYSLLIRPTVRKNSTQYYYSFNFIFKLFFFSSYMSNCVVASTLPHGPQSLKCLLADPSEMKFANPCCGGVFVLPLHFTSPQGLRERRAEVEPGGRQGQSTGGHAGRGKDLALYSEQREASRAGRRSGPHVSHCNT